jgi:hypothetical protein
LCVCEYFNNSAGKYMRYFPIRMQNKQIYYSLSINSAWNLRLIASCCEITMHSVRKHII